MNIFVLDENPILAAEYQCDKHVVKMLLETTQMLCAIHRVYTAEILTVGPKGKMVPSFIDPVKDSEIYKVTHFTHPCMVWARKTNENYNWLSLHWASLAAEYQKRYKMHHKCIDLILKYDEIFNAPAQLPFTGLTPFVQAMPDKYKCEDAVQAYRNYYKGEKASFAKWKLNNEPYWWR